MAEKLRSGIEPVAAPRPAQQKVAAEPESKAAIKPSAAKKRRKWPWILAAVLAVLVGVFLVADHLIRQYAERQLISELQQVFQDSSVTRVDAELGGWPFMLVAVDNNLQTGHIELDDMRGTISGAPVRLVTAAVDFENLYPVNDVANATVGVLTASATFDWDTLNAQLHGVQVAHDSGNRVMAVTSVEVFGVPIEVMISGEVRLANGEGSLVFATPRAEVAGISVPDSIVQGVIAQVQDQLRLPELPGIRYETVGVSETGVGVSVTGHNVKLSDLQ